MMITAGLANTSVTSCNYHFFFVMGKFSSTCVDELALLGSSLFNHQTAGGPVTPSLTRAGRPLQVLSETASQPLCSHPQQEELRISGSRLLLR